MAARPREAEPDGGQGPAGGQQAAGTPRPLLRAARPAAPGAKACCVCLTRPGQQVRRPPARGSSAGPSHPRAPRARPSPRPLPSSRPPPVGGLPSIGLLLLSGPGAALESARRRAGVAAHRRTRAATGPARGGALRAPPSLPAPAALPSPAPGSPGLRAARPARDALGVPEEVPAWPRRDDGRAAARPPADRHHHRQLLRGELLHQQQQLRLRPGVPPHRARAPHRGGDRECLAGWARGGGAQTDPRARLGLGANSDPPTGFEGARVAQPLLFPKVRNPETTSLNEGQTPWALGEEGRGRRDVREGRNPTCWALSVVAACVSRSRMLGGHCVCVSECHEHLVLPLPNLHVNGLLPKAKLSRDRKTREDSFLFLRSYLSGSKIEANQETFTE